MDQKPGTVDVTASLPDGASRALFEALWDVYGAWGRIPLVIAGPGVARIYASVATALVEAGCVERRGVLSRRVPVAADTVEES